MLIGLLLLLIDLGSFTATAILNPGIPDRDLKKYDTEFLNSMVQKKSLGFCPKCKIIRNSGMDTQHCMDCDICVEGYDHHCPWTGKCIGRGNAVYFYTFLSSTFILLFYMMGSAILTL